MSNVEIKKIKISVLFIVAVVASIIILLLIWYYIYSLQKTAIPDSYGAFAIEVFKGLMPNIVSSLIIALTVYFIYERYEAEEKLVIKDDYHHHNWDNYIQRSHKIDIVANYFDKWLARNQESLIIFLRKGGKLRIIMSKTDSPEELLLILRHFQDLNQNDLQIKIDLTVKELKELNAKSRAKEKQIQVYYYDFAISYPLIRIGNTLAVFSFFKHNWDVRYDSEPSILINADEPVFNKFLENEINYLISKSTHFNIWNV